MSVTDSKAIRKRVEDRRTAAAQAEQRALVETLSTPSGRRVWLWIRDVVCLADRRAGRWEVTDALDKRLVEYPELRIALAKDRAAIEADDAIHAADLKRLEKEETPNG